MNGTLNLKIFISISLGLHLLFLSIASILFPEFKIDRLPVLNIEVSLLPLITEERPISIPFPPPRVNPVRNSSGALNPAGIILKSNPAAEQQVIISNGVKNQIKKEEENLSPRESKEELTYEKELEPESPHSVQTVATNILTEGPKPLSLENRRLELGNEKEPVIQAMNISLPIDPPVTFEEGTHSHSLTKDDIHQKEDLTIAMPQSKVSHGNPNPNTTPLEEPLNVVKLQPPSGGEVLFSHPKYAENPKPLYPQEARKKGFEGEVVLRVEVLSDGQVGRVEVKKSSGYELLDRSALTTVKHWKFIPAKRGEEAISLWVNIPIKFQLQ